MAAGPELTDADARSHRSAVRVLPLHDGDLCGDAALHLRLDAAADAHLLAIIDGLGHGGQAALAAQAAQAVIEARPHLPLPALFTDLEAALVRTRGAAIGLARIEGARLRYAGVGNTRALRWRDTTSPSRLLLLPPGEDAAAPRGGPAAGRASWLRLSSQYGIVGGGLPECIDVTDIDLQPGDWVLLYTDGLEEMLHLPVALPEWVRDPAVLCDHLLAHFRNRRDDAGVLAVHIGAV